MQHFYYELRYTAANAATTTVSGYHIPFDISLIFKSFVNSLRLFFFNADLCPKKVHNCFEKDSNSRKRDEPHFR